MIYTVEITFSAPDQEAAWNDWYSPHLFTLLSVPGFETAQRFRRPSGSGYAYLAAYSISTAGVFESDAYRAIGGGGVASSRWKSAIRRKRNLFDGLERLPEVSDDHRLVLLDQPALPKEPPDLIFVPLHAIALDRSVELRLLAIVHPEDAARHQLAEDSRFAVYTPMTERRLATRSSQP
jgi:hypothetical protein